MRGFLNFVDDLLVVSTADLLGILVALTFSFILGFNDYYISYYTSSIYFMLLVGFLAVDLLLGASLSLGLIAQSSK